MLTSIPPSSFGVHAVACGLALASTPPTPLVRQLERVLISLLPAGAPAGTDSADVLARLRPHRLLSPVLFRTAEAVLAEARAAGSASPLSAEQLGIAFAASIYPQRAFALQANDSELSNRLRAFLGSWVATRNGPFSGLHMGEAREALLAVADLEGLLADLGDAVGFGAPDPSSNPVEFGERRNGALLFLSTLNAPELERIIEARGRDAGFVGYVRRCLSSSPSELTRMDPPTAAALSALLPLERTEHHVRAIALEMSTRRLAAARGYARSAAQCVADFWAAQWTLLVSGFPYFAYLSSFFGWWMQCAAHHSWMPQRAQSLDTLPPGLEPVDRRISDDPVDPGFWLCPSNLRWLREGYRLVRTTFFRRADLARSVGHPADANPNERLRMAVDALWYGRIEKHLDSSEDAALVKEVAAKFPDLGPKVIRNVSFRLRRRIWAYTAARFLGLPTSRIRFGIAEGAAESGIFKVASAGRAVPIEESLIWLFAAHIYVVPRLESSRPDPWNWRQLVGEIWHWVSDPHFDTAMLRCGAEPHPLAALTRGVLDSADIHGLLVRLKSIRDEEELARYLDVVAEGELSAIFEGVMPSVPDAYRHAVERLMCAGCRRSWAEVRANHLVSPVWYLSALMGLAEGPALDRVAPDEHEQAPAARLHLLMKKSQRRGCRAHPPGGRDGR